MSWDLGARRKEWKRWIKAELAENGSTQATVANAIADASDGKSKTTTLSNFISGDPDMVQRWFEDHQDWVTQLEDGGMGCFGGALRTRFQDLMTGDAPALLWHPAFPEVQAFDVEIPAPLLGGLGRSPSDVAQAWVAEVRQYRETGAQRELTVLAPAGRSRDLAVSQLRAALEAELATEPPIVGASGDDKTSGWGVLATEKRLPDSGRFVRLAPWEAADVAALADRLAVAGRLAETHRQGLRKFAALLRTGTEPAALALTPDLAIWLLAEVARGGCPASLVEMRERVTAGAWRRATADSDRLPALGESLLDHYFAGAARRVKPATEAGSWHTVPAQDATRLLHDAAAGLVGAAAGRPLGELTEAVAAARGDKARAAAIDALREALRADPAPALLTELVDGGVLLREARDSASWIRPAEPQLAAMWAARGLGPECAISAPWAALFDPEWGALMEEQARRGASFAGLKVALSGVPDALAIDKALVLLRHANAAPELIDDQALTTAWATALWGVTHEFLESQTWGRTWGWTVNAAPDVSAFTHRYRRVLPRMGADPVNQVSGLVPAEPRRLVQKWRATDRGHVLSAMMRVARSAFVLDTPARFGDWGLEPHQAAHRVIEEAEAGDLGCQAMLSGAARFTSEEGKCRNMYTRFWTSLPWEVRVDWAARAEASGGLSVDVLDRLIRERGDKGGQPRLLDVAERVGPPAMRDACRRPFEGLGSLGWGLTPEFAIAVAERMRLLDVLEFIATRPHAVAAATAPKLTGGVLFVGRLGVKLSGTDGFEPAVPLTEAVVEADQHARLAAEALHRLGRPEALRARWLEAGPELPLESRRAARRIEGLAGLACTPLWNWVDRELLLDGLGAFADLELPEHAEYALCRLVQHPRAFKGLEGLLPNEVPLRVARGLRGLSGLLFEIPDPFPEDLDALFSRSHYPYGRDRSLQIERGGTEDRRTEAAKTLVLFGDDGPIHIWAAGMPAEGDTPQHARAAARAVQDLISTEPAVFERCWGALVGSGRTDEQSRHQRWHLLKQGSIRPALPLAFVVAEMVADPDPGELEDLTHRNGHQKEWLPVIRKAMITAPDPRSRAQWALLAARHEPGSPNLRSALEHWGLSDPDPWAGGAEWHRVESAYVGGARSLLAALLMLNEPWVIGALRRLLDLAVTLPLGSSHERADEPPPHVCLATFDDDAPWPIDDLAEALTRRDHVKFVLDVWRRSRPAPLESEDRARKLRSWLMPWWTKHASDDDLRASLWGSESFSPTIAFELASRRVPGVADDLERALAEGFTADWYPLAQLAPERLPEALAASLAAISTSPASWREMVSSYASTVDGLAVYSAALAAREHIASAPDDPYLPQEPSP